MCIKEQIIVRCVIKLSFCSELNGVYCLSKEFFMFEGARAKGLLTEGIEVVLIGPLSGST